MSAIPIASDHAGLALKQFLLTNLKNFEFEDLGTHDNASVDYPDFADRVCRKVSAAKPFGILICGSGQGMAIRANRFAHIRAAICWTEEVARLARQHNNANVLCMGARLIDFQLAAKITEAFLTTNFEGGRHAARVDKFNQPC